MLSGQSIETAASGTLLIQGRAFFRNTDAADANIGMFARLDGTQVGLSPTAFNVLPTGETDFLSFVTAAGVDSGEHDVELLVGHANSAGNPTAGDFFVNRWAFTALFVPGGAAPSSAPGEVGGSLTGD